MTSIAPYRFDLVDDPNNPLIRRSIPVGTRYEITIVVLDLASGPPGAVVDPSDPLFDPGVFTPIDLSGFVGVRSSLRKHPRAEGATLADFVATITDAINGEINLVLTVASTEALQQHKKGTGFDVEVFDNTAAPNQDVQRVCYGVWETTAESTRANT